ncbi:MAG TPA: MFS transporter [Anaerolineales bacterium]|nr:MFS transporter [Anaerolineales bacterium]
MKAFLRSTFQQFRILNRPAWLFLVALFFNGLLFSGWSLFFNLFIIDAGHSRDFLGLANAAPSFSALLMGVPMGLLSDRMGRKSAMMIGFALSSFSAIGMVLAHTETWIIVFAILYGITGQLYFISQAPFMMRVSDDHTRDVLFSLSFGMFPLASTLGNFLSGYLPGMFTHWFGLTTPLSAYKAVLLFSVLSSFVVLLPIAFIHEHKPGAEEIAAEQNAPKVSIWKAILRPQTLKLSLPNLVIGFGAAMLVPYFNVFFAEKHQMSDASLGILFSVGSLATAIGCLIGPRLVGRLGGKVRTVVLFQTVSLVFLLATGFSPWLWLAALGYLVRGALMNMVAPLFDAYALEQSPKTEHGAVNSLRNLAWNVGWAVGPGISGFIQQRWGYTPLFINTAILYAVGNVLIWFFFRPKNSPASVGVQTPAN